VTKKLAIHLLVGFATLKVIKIFEDSFRQLLFHAMTDGDNNNFVQHKVKLPITTGLQPTRKKLLIFYRLPVLGQGSISLTFYASLYEGRSQQCKKD